jgi:hypothetical protein
MQIRRLIHLTTAVAILLAAASCSKPEAATAAASATPAAAAPAFAPRGLPMWVIRDADSTIYLTGTIHMLPPQLEWRSPRLEAALDEADELWLELAMPSDVEAFRREAEPFIMRHAKSSGPPLSSRLGETERKALADAIGRAGLPPEAMAELDRMQPWYVSNVISVAPLAAAGFKSEAGIDITLAKMARDQGAEIKGLEKIEEQVLLMSGASEADQLGQLRAFLAVPPAMSTGVAWIGGKTFEQWAGGNTLPVELLISTMYSARGAQRRQVDALLTNRNENWAGQIEEMLKGSGVSFIAVGAGHLVGPESVQKRLKLRGIAAERY